MVTRLLLTLFLVAVLPGTGCAVEEEVGLYKPVELTSGLRQGIERLKREFLQLEDLKIGDGPIAAWGRKVSVDIEVRYVDGTLVYRGPAFAYVGLEGTVLIHNNFNDGMLSLQQDGIILGLNGKAVGGKRRMPSLATWSATKVPWANPLPREPTPEVPVLSCNEIGRKPASIKSAKRP